MSTALYRRYRPDRFEDVIGQDHVTVPLRTALSKDRVNHAYLFSGPRGCGKTTSARILARCLNCAQGPTPTPCGECDSCRDLATGGPGSLDVMEIDAASHGGVEDARGLRERATFAPVRDRYKILIIDEAHMVTAAGFNALLKIVEEPPEHLKFIFATTEPDKVIGTIRSRTHHYPFRLVPPEPLIAYLEQLCAEEHVRVEPGVLPLVVRAGTGSVRDTLSVLDQLIGGAQDGAVSYELAVSLLGFTPEALLDDVVDALAADDPPTVFRVVDRVVQSGQDPRRFVEDLLDRFRDLVIARALPEEAGAILHGMPEDQVRRLAAQAAQLSRAELSRLADVTNEALTEMVGATSPRLHLELLMARLLLPATDDAHRGLAARLEALERRLALGGVAELPADDAGAAPGAPVAGAPRGQADPAAADGQGGLSGAALARAAMRRAESESAPPATPTSAPPAVAEPAAAQPHRPQQWSVPAPAPEGDAEAAEHPAEAPAAPAPATHPVSDAAPEAVPAPTPTPQERPEGPGRPEEAPGQPPVSASSGAALSGGAGPATSQVEMVRRAWPDILAALEDASRLVWMLVKDNATVAGYDGSLLTVGFTQDGPRQSLLGRRGDQVLAEAVHRVLGIRPELDLILGGDAPREDRPSAGARPARPERPGQPARRPEPPSQAPAQQQPQQPAGRSPQAGSGAEAPPRAAGQRPVDQRPVEQGPAQQAERSRRPSSAETTPAPAPAEHGWGRPDEEPPAWDDAPPPAEDPWDSLPEFDPDADMEDSPGPEGWVAPPGTVQEGDVPQTTPGSGASGAGTGRADGWDGPVPTTADWGTPPDASGPDASGPDAARPDDPGTGAPSAAVPAEEAAPSPEDVRRAYDPGPLVREEEHAIPVFARPEAELRAEFAARFGATRPRGFDAAAEAPTPATPARPGGPRAGQDAAEGGGEEAADEREDPHPAAAGTDRPVPDSPTRPTADDTPDPGVPAEHHADPGPGGTSGAAADAPAASSEAPADGPAARGSGHPDSWFGPLMERLAAGGPLEPPVNARPGGTAPDGPASTGTPPAGDPPPGGPSSGSGPAPSGRPSAAALGTPGEEAPAPVDGPPAPDPRAAAIRAAREAARGGGTPRAAAVSAPDAGPAASDWAEEVASEDDVALEDSGLVGRPVVERLLGARLLEERPLEGGL